MPLTLRRTYDEPDHYSVYSGDVLIGTIYFAVNITKPNPAWFWALNGIMTGPAGMHFSGYAEDLEAAKTAFREAWEHWLHAAGLVEGPR
jgi:hypothetical protein